MTLLAPSGKNPASGRTSRLMTHPRYIEFIYDTFNINLFVYVHAVRTLVVKIMDRLIKAGPQENHPSGACRDEGSREDLRKGDT